MMSICCEGSGDRMALLLNSAAGRSAWKFDGGERECLGVINIKEVPQKG